MNCLECALHFGMVSKEVFEDSVEALELIELCLHVGVIRLGRLKTSTITRFNDHIQSHSNVWMRNIQDILA